MKNQIAPSWHFTTNINYPSVILRILDLEAWIYVWLVGWLYWRSWRGGGKRECEWGGLEGGLGSGWWGRGV